MLGEYSKDLEFYHLNSSYGVVDYVSKLENNPRPIGYSSIVTLTNDEHLPLFVEDTVDHQL